jgi:biotin carboxylase
VLSSIAHQARVPKDLRRRAHRQWAHDIRDVPALQRLSQGLDGVEMTTTARREPAAGRPRPTGRRQSHVLIMGTCGEMPVRIWTARAGARTSVITTPAELPELIGAAEHETVMVTGEQAPIADWVKLARCVDEIRSVSAVVAFADQWMPHAAAASEALGLGGHSTGTVQLVHSKISWRNRLRSAGVEDVPATTVNGGPDVEAFGDSHGWPVIVKPARGTGSLGVTRVDSPLAAPAAYDWARRAAMTPADGVLVERYLTGTHLMVNTFSENGEHAVVTMTKDFFGPPHMVSLGNCMPAPIESAERDAVAKHVAEALSVVGVESGPAATEVRITSQGPRTVECQLRLDGGNYPRLAYTTLGVDVADLWARQLLGEQVMPRLRRQLDEPRSGRYGASWWAYPDVDGVLLSIEGLDAVKTAPGVLGMDIRAAPGDKVGRLTNSDDRVVQVFAEHEQPHAALRAARTAAERLSFVVSTAGMPINVV